MTNSFLFWWAWEVLPHDENRDDVQFMERSAQFGKVAGIHSRNPYESRWESLGISKESLGIHRNLSLPEIREGLAEAPWILEIPTRDCWKP